MSDSPEGGITPEAAFALLGDETRIAIVQELGETRGEPLSFSELRDRVGARDSGGFNYHLTKLVGTFVDRTDDGYELSYAGVRIVGAILAGEYTNLRSAGAFELESACTACESPLEATYRDERVTIRCPDCDELRTRFGFLPGGFENRSPGELTAVFDRWLTNVTSLIADGFCYNCAGKTSGRLTDELAHVGGRSVGVEFACERCADRTALSISTYLLSLSPVVAFHYERGVDIGEVDAWNLASVLDDEFEIRSRDPLWIRSAIELEDDRLELTLEEDLSVTVDE